jgi:hypothetical protein
MVVKPSLNAKATGCNPFLKEWQVWQELQEWQELQKSSMPTVRARIPDC